MSSPRDQTVFLIGLPGAGKSTVGRALARCLGRSFVDLDDRIVAEAGRSIPAIFAAEGEGGFRAREQRALNSQLRESRDRDRAVVVACGGGIVNRRVNRDRLARGGVTLWLDVPVETARARVTDGFTSRPLASILISRPRQLQRRQHWYGVVGARVPAAGPVAAVVESALQALRRQGIAPIRS